MGRQAVDTYNKCHPKYGDTINPFNKTVDPSEFSPTLTTRPEGFKTAILPITSNYRLRKLTPKECWRLMGFRDEDIDKCYELKVSDSQLYKQAGNSIITYCIALLMEHLYKAQYDNTYVCTDEKILNNRRRIL
ncbi:MAG: hypothetical protein GX963_07595 [Bacteroidales bacterium]|nr:hypothetical protein [Bacteroidales bacterium]